MHMTTYSNHNYNLEFNPESHFGIVPISSSTAGRVQIGGDFDSQPQEHIGVVMSEADVNGIVTVFYHGRVNLSNCGYHVSCPACDRLEELGIYRNNRFVFKTARVCPKTTEDLLRDQTISNAFFRNPYKSDYLWNFIIKFGHWDFPIVLANNFPIYL